MWGSADIPRVPCPAPSLPTGCWGSHLHGVKAQILSRPPHLVLSLPSSSFQRGAAIPELLVACLPVCDVPADPAGASGAVKEHASVGGGRRAWARPWTLNSVHASPRLCGPEHVTQLSGPYSHQMGHQFIYSGWELIRGTLDFILDVKGRSKAPPETSSLLSAPVTQASSLFLQHIRLGPAPGPLHGPCPPPGPPFPVLSRGGQEPLIIYEHHFV